MNLPYAPQIECWSGITAENNEDAEKIFKLVNLCIKQAEVELNKSGINCRIAFGKLLAWPK